ncbi:MAG: SBBP repeat-containing protein, partial [Anaerolineae bacterium]|nr:SBBP repeat-containing protein [Anaerolineae bacterium]
MNKRLFGLMIILACGIGLIIGLVAMEKPALAGPHDANLTRSHEDAGSISKAKNPVKDSDSSPLMALPLRFIPNVGQYAPEVSFSVQGAGHTLAFTPNGITMHAVVETENIPQEPAHPHTISLEFEGALPSPTLGGLDLMRGVINDFRGNDSAEWHANIPTYAGILYQDLYPGIDLVYRGTQGVLKSEFIVQPGVDPAMIRMHYQGLESLTLRDDGALVLTTPFGELIEAAPVIYQENTGKRQSITGRYVILAPDLVGFQIDAYDSTMPLVIDPELAYASYLGGSNSDEGNGIAVDKDGSIYVTGGTYSTDFPLVGHYQNYQADYDVFVTKIVNVYGTYDYAYSTYIGGSKVDIGQDIAIDKDGAAYVSGYTLSSDFPTQDALQPSRGGGYDAFVIRIDDLGGSCTLGYASYLGGSDNEYGYGIATGQGAGRTPTHGVAVVGQTYSNDFPTHNAPSEALSGTSDAFVVHMIMVGESYTYTYATYLGSSGFEDGKAIALDSDGNAHVTGYTTSVDFPTTKNALEQNPIGDYDAYLVRIAESGGSYTYTYASYLGGTGRDYGEGIAIDTQDRVYVTGNTDSTDLPTTAGVLQPGYGGGTRDAYVIQIVETGGFYSYGYATYVGGSDADYGWDIATDIEGNASVTGDTASADFPKFAPLDATLGGTRDAFVAQIIDAGSTYTYSYATYLGGGNLDRGWDIASAGYGHVYITGRTDSADFPTFKALDTTLSGSRDAFVAKILGQNGLKIQKTVTPDLIGIGQRLTYTLAFANESLSPTSGIIITDIVPITLTNLTVSHDGAAITPTGATNFTWQVATLGAEEGGTIEISGIADPSLSGVFSITNQATITSTTLEESPGDNVSSVSSSADLVRPQPPVLVAPGNGTSITDTTPTLVWQASSSDDVAGYRLNVDGAITDVGNVTSTTLSTLADGAYIWTVVAYDQANNSSTVPATRTFTVDTTPPTPPTLITPEDDAFLNDATPTLRWQASPDPDVAGYQLDLAGALIDVGNVTSYTTALLADGSYTWTVAAYDVLFTSAFTD